MAAQPLVDDSDVIQNRAAEVPERPSVAASVGEITKNATDRIAAFLIDFVVWCLIFFQLFLGH